VGLRENSAFDAMNKTRRSMVLPDDPKAEARDIRKCDGSKHFVDCG
jgi:hypothetical protein